MKIQYIFDNPSKKTKKKGRKRNKSLANVKKKAKNRKVKKKLQKGGVLAKRKHSKKKNPHYTAYKDKKTGKFTGRSKNVYSSKELREAKNAWKKSGKRKNKLAKRYGKLAFKSLANSKARAASDKAHASSEKYARAFKRNMKNMILKGKPGDPPKHLKLKKSKAKKHHKKSKSKKRSHKRLRLGKLSRAEKRKLKKLNKSLLSQLQKEKVVAKRKKSKKKKSHHKRKAKKHHKKKHHKKKHHSKKKRSHKKRHHKRKQKVLAKPHKGRKKMRKGKRKHLRKHSNPIEGAMNMADDKLKELTGLEGKELAALAGGAIGGPIIAALARKFVPQIASLDTMVPGSTNMVNALLLGALGVGCVVLGEKKRHEGLRVIGEGLVASQVVLFASQFTTTVGSMVGLSGVDFIPMNGVDYTPLAGIPAGLQGRMGLIPAGMRGVDYTPLKGAPQMSGTLGRDPDFGSYDTSDYGGGGGYTEGRKLSTADFGGAGVWSADQDDEPALDSNNSMV